MHKIAEYIKKVIHKNILKRYYYRKGRCSGCGACCQKIYIRHTNSVINNEEEFLKLKRLHPFYTYLEIIDKDDLGLVFKCNNFDFENKNCLIHKDRPGICRRYPSEQIFSMKAMLSENCGYSFDPIESFSEVFDNAEKKIKKS